MRSFLRSPTSFQPSKPYSALQAAFLADVKSLYTASCVTGTSSPTLVDIRISIRSSHTHSAKTRQHLVRWKTSVQTEQTSQIIQWSGKLQDGARDQSARRRKDKARLRKQGHCVLPAFWDLVVIGERVFVETACHNRLSEHKEWFGTESL